MWGNPVRVAWGNGLRLDRGEIGLAQGSLVRVAEASDLKPALPLRSNAPAAADRLHSMTSGAGVM